MASRKSNNPYQPPTTAPAQPELVPVTGRIVNATILVLAIHTAVLGLLVSPWLYAHMAATEKFLTALHAKMPALTVFVLAAYDRCGWLAFIGLPSLVVLALAVVLWRVRSPDLRLALTALACLLVSGMMLVILFAIAAPYMQVAEVLT
jgi:hypothetical protein